MIKLSFPFTEEKIRALKAGDEALISAPCSPGAKRGSCKPADFGFNSIMQTLEKIEDELRQLSKAEQEALRDWLENLLEDELEFTDEFKAKIERGEQDIRAGRVRVHKP